MLIAFILLQWVRIQDMLSEDDDYVEYAPTPGDDLGGYGYDG
jgi:hypothetical protein